MVALDTFQRKDKAARSRQATPTSYPHYNRTLSALSFGGPIVKDKIHFFGSYEGNIQNRANRVSILAPPAGFPALDTCQPRPSTTATSDRRSARILLFGKLSDADQRQVVRRVELQQPPRDRRSRLRRKPGFAAASNNHNYNTAVQLKHNFFTGPWLNEAQLELHALPPRLQPEHSGYCRTVIHLSDRLLLRDRQLTSQQEYIQKGPGFRDDLTYTGFQLAGEHVFKGGVSSTSRHTTSTRTTTGRRSSSIRTFATSGSALRSTTTRRRSSCDMEREIRS